MAIDLTSGSCGALVVVVVADVSAATVGFLLDQLRGSAPPNPDALRTCHFFNREQI